MDQRVDIFLLRFSPSRDDLDLDNGMFDSSIQETTAIVNDASVIELSVYPFHQLRVNLIERAGRIERAACIRDELD